MHPIQDNQSFFQLLNWVSSPKILKDIPDDIPPFQMGDFGTPVAMKKSTINKMSQIIQQVRCIKHH